ncbi:MAG: GNAT family N-acetyltransferase [Gammaproteobacteria bacterium]|nr:GNAT family N-acetyltransferase [Gammaproteobacteria bacterium]
MITAISIRAAVPSDAPRLSALGREVFIDTYSGTASAHDIQRHVDDYFGESTISYDLGQASVQYLLAIDDESCAGLVKLREGDTPTLVSAANAIEVQQLYVSTDFQRMGIGRRLMDSAVATAQERGSAGIWLSVWTEADWATKFYLDYGFISLGEIPFMLGDTEYVDYLMWLPFDGS